MMTRLPLLALVALLTPALAARAQAQSAAEVQEMPALQELMAAALNEFSGAQQSRSSASRPLSCCRAATCWSRT